MIMQDKNWQVAETMEYMLLKENAKSLRHNMTESENAFWQLARSCGLGEQCRRQYIIGEYIVDFFFRKSMLVIEIDGGYHRPSQPPLKGGEEPQWYNDPEQVQRDKERQDWLNQMGYTVLRFTNEQVLCDTENVIKIVKQHLNGHLPLGETERL